MSMLSKATKAESDAYAAMVDAQADVIALQLEHAAHAVAGIYPAAVEQRLTKLRARSAALRKVWLAAARKLEDATTRAWA